MMGDYIPFIEFDPFAAGNPDRYENYKWEVFLLSGIMPMQFVVMEKEMEATHCLSVRFEIEKFEDNLICTGMRWE